MTSLRSEWNKNLSRFHENPLWALRTTKSNCRVSSIDFYLIFPTSFRIITLPLTPDCPYTVIIHIRILTLALSLSLGQLCLIGACFVFSYSKGPLHIQKKINNNNKSIIRNSIITFFSQFLTCGYDFYCLKWRLMSFILLLYELYRQTADTFVNVSWWLFVGLSDSGFVSVYSPIITNNFSSSFLFFNFWFRLS